MKYKLMAIVLISSFIAGLSACSGGSSGAAENNNWDTMVWDRGVWQ